MDQDVTSRDRVCAPSGKDLSIPLFRKVPWPRFEGPDKSSTITVSSEPGYTLAKAININKREKSGLRDTAYMIEVKD